MQQRLALIVAISGLLSLAARGRADELVLDLTTKLGIDKTVKVRNVTPASQYPIVSDLLLGRFLGFTPDFPPREKRFLALGSHASKALPYPAFAVGIPWDSIKEFTNEKGIGSITCEDGAKFQGVIVTEITAEDGAQYPLWQVSKLAVKKYTSKLQDKPHKGPIAKCHVRFDDMEHTFHAKKVGYQAGSQLPSEKFEMKVGDELTAGVLSDFDKLTVKGTESGPIQITVRAPSGKETTGELETFGQASFAFRAANGCAIVVELRFRRRSAMAPKASFQITIENTKAGERLPLELFAPVEKKK